MRDTCNLSNWQPCERPGKMALFGKYAICEPYVPGVHSAGLFDAVGGTGNADLWTYMSVGPFADQMDMEKILAQVNPAVPTETSWQTMVIRSKASGEILGVASYMRIREMHGSAEVGAVAFNKKMQRTTIATDAMYLMARHVFCDLGYRRYEWKCNNANAASKRAALRFGFAYEGVFRNDMVAKGKNRDTAWYAITGEDWPSVQAGFEAWLTPGNFDVSGIQRQSLKALCGG